MNISAPDKNSDIYKQFTKMMNHKVKLMVDWLGNKNIGYVWNNWINNHLYRICIPSIDTIFDFEYYPININEYNYIRIDFDTDVILLLEKLFPETILDTKDLTVWKLNQKACNKFLRKNNASPIYDKTALRLAWVKDKTIYQCIVVKNDKIISNVTKRNCSVQYGTYMMLRYLTEMFGFSEIFINESTSNSFINDMYRIIKVDIIKQNHKKKIWWSPEGTKWKIKKEQTDKFIPFYFCETRIYRYSNL